MKTFTYLACLIVTGHCDWETLCSLWGTSWRWRDIWRFMRNEQI